MIFRVEIHRDGSVASCDVVESALKNGGLVCYVEAKDKAEACQKAKKTFADRMAALKLPGSCIKCKQPRMQGYLMCAAHNEAAVQKQRERNSLKKQGLWSKELAVERLAAGRLKLAAKGVAAAPGCFDREAADRKWDSVGHAPSKSARSVLRQCLRAYDRDPANFREWLLAKLGRSESVAAE